MSLITEVDILDEARDNFLTYAEEVLTDRAIPAAEDGLLSAQRKILWTMADYLKMDSNSKTKKCNALVGSTLATSYFHGDAACYGVLRKMSQEYLMRYPLIKGQGSLGTQENNDMFSAPRYTEAKPSIYADLMMSDFKKDVVPLKETYNGEFMEPIVLPGFFPNALCNGKQAIGISMSHNSAPHNLTEICDATIAFINRGALSTEELLEIVPGPDFPLGGTILNSKDVRAAFETGKSSVSLKIQGDYEIDGQKIIFTTIPYRTYRNKIKEQIEKNIETFAEVLDDYDDDSNVGQNKLTFYVKKDVSPQKALDKLFNLTDLQTTLSYNMNYIVNGTPKLCSMVDLISAYVNHQETVLIRATEYDKKKAEARAHILRGLIAAVDKIDEVITLIKQSSDKAEARSRLIDFLSIDDIQANAILDMRLGKLTRIDKEELVTELQEKEAFILYCNNLLNNKDARNQELITRITKLRDEYGDERRTKLLNIEAPKTTKTKEEPIPEDCTITITQKGLIKRASSKSLKTQRSDATRFTAFTNTLCSLMVFTSGGRMYKCPVNAIPEGANGVPISSLIQFENSEIPIAYTMVNSDSKYILFATRNGIIKKTPLEEYDKIAKRTGVIAINFKEEDTLADITFINQEEVMLITERGMAIRFAASGIPISSRTAQGVKGITLSEGDHVVKVLPVSNAADYLAIVSETGMGKKTKLSEFTAQNRGGKGIICFKHDSDLVGSAAILTEKDKVFISGNKSSVTLDTKDLPTMNRNTSGNIVIKNNNKVTVMEKI